MSNRAAFDSDARALLTEALQGAATGIRARVGLPIGDTLPYVTGGIPVADVQRSFASSSTANTFVTWGDDKTVHGLRFGGGSEQRVGRITLGAVYLYTDYKDGGYRVRAQGPAPATNPFILVNSGGTDFRRDDNRFKTHSLNATVSYRF